MTGPNTPDGDAAHRMRLAKAHRDQGTAETEDALEDAIAVPPTREGVAMRYSLPDGRTTRSLPKALGAWLDAVTPRRGGARPGAGRKPTRPEGTRKVQVVMSPAAAAAWDAYKGDRSAWVSLLIEQAKSDP